MKQFVDKDLELFKYQGYVAYDGQANSVQGVQDKQTKLVRHPTPPKSKMRPVSTEREMAMSEAKEASEKEKLTYA